VEQGFLEKAINRTRQKREQSVARGATTFVGINHYPEPDAAMRDEIDRRFISSSLLQSDQPWSLNKKAPLFSLSKAFREGARLGDVMQDLIQPSRQYLQTIQPGRGPSPFENIRLQTEAHTRQTGSRPTVLFIPMGTPEIRNQRKNFAANLRGCAGYKLIEPLGFEKVEEAQTKIKEVKPDVAVLCAPDELYGEITKKIGSWLTNQPITPILALAGYPKEQVKTLQNHGIQFFIHKGSNRFELLKAFQLELGIESNQTAENQYIH
jgi:methylmalonyl-CoA mutase cobalamin-binding subunit